MKQFVFVWLLCSVLILSHFPLIIAEGDSWETMEPMPTARSGLGVAVVDGKIYAIGGNSVGTNEMYDPVTNTWTTKKSMPTARNNFGIAVFQNKIHVMGGYVGSGYLDVHEVYDVETDTWETRNSSSSYGAYFSANVVDDRIFLIGGSLSLFTPWFTSNENRVYHPLTDTWTIKEPLSTAVSNYASTVLDNKVYVIGGHDVQINARYDFNQVYDVETDTWNYETPIPSADIVGAEACATSGFFAPKRIHVLDSDFHYIYDPEKDEWTTAIPMLTPRHDVGVAVVDDFIYVIGGYDGDNHRTENEKFTPSGYIPEFSSWVVLPLFLTVTLFVVVSKRKLSKTPN